MQFIHPSLITLGMWFLAAPILIHLINMLRHQRVQWAAMEFLLVSQKKHRTWVVLKQLLLLLLRILALAAVVLALAQPLLPDRWGNMLGAQHTHHIVLLDDSFSMSDHWGETTAFDQAKEVVARIASSAAHKQQMQSFTLVRLSRCGQYGGGLQPDLARRQVTQKFPDDLKNILDAMRVSQTAATPLSALDVVEQLMGEEQGDRREIYLISDFRTPQWDKPEELKKRFVDLIDRHAEIHFIDCVESVRPNLAVTGLEPEEGIRAAGTRWRMEVGVQNFGTVPAHNVQVFWTADGHAGPPEVIDKIAPGAVVRQPFEVNFASAGEHLISAHIERDAVTADNFRYAVVNLPVDLPVLLVDGDPTAPDAKTLGAAMAPGGPIKSGIRVRIETPRFLSLHPLDEFSMVCVANFEHLDRTAVEALEKYAAAGGGVLFCVGDLTRGEVVNRELYRDGKGIFPLPLSNPEPLLPDPLETAPDIHSENHFLFRYGVKMDPVLVERYFATTKEFMAKNDPAVKVIMRLRNRAPLMVEKAFGQGRAMAFLSRLRPGWNNWAESTATGTFAGIARELVTYLSLRANADSGRLVGEPLKVEFSSAKYNKQVKFLIPAGDADPAASAQVDGVPPGDIRSGGNASAKSASELANGSAAKSSEDSTSKPDGKPAVASDTLIAQCPRTLTAGFYEAQLLTTDQKAESRHFAVNVDPAEGDLKALDGTDLAARMAPVPINFQSSASFTNNLSDAGGHNLGDFLLYFLILILVCEQLFAWSAGYHPVSRSTKHSVRPGSSASPSSTARPSYAPAEGAAV
jgi:hypothetical protein